MSSSPSKRSSLWEEGRRRTGLLSPRDSAIRTSAAERLQHAPWDGWEPCVPGGSIVCGAGCVRGSYLEAQAAARVFQGAGKDAIPFVADLLQAASRVSDAAHDLAFVVRTQPNALTEYLAHEDAALRGAAHDVLRIIGSADGSQRRALLSSLEDPDPQTRLNAAFLLAGDPVEGVIPVLRAALREGTSGERWIAVEGIARMGERARPLVDDLVEDFNQIVDPDNRGPVVSAIVGAFGNNLQPAVEWLGDDSWHTLGRSVLLRAGERALPHLERALEPSHPLALRRHAAELLSELSFNENDDEHLEDKARALLVPYVDDDDEWVRYHALGGIYWASDQRAVAIDGMLVLLVAKDPSIAYALAVFLDAETMTAEQRGLFFAHRDHVHQGVRKAVRDEETEWKLR